MKYFSVCLGISLFALISSLHAENPPAAAPAPKLMLIDKSKPAACDSDCDDKPVTKSRWTLTKPVLMSPKAAAAAGNSRVKVSA